MSKILIIEDEYDVVKVVSKRLSDAGFETVVAGDAYQGVDLAHKEKPDLIILDLMLPAGGGIKVLKDIRISSHTAYIPVVVLTGMQDAAYKKNILDQGVEAYLEKPYDAEELIETIKSILAK